MPDEKSAFDDLKDEGVKTDELVDAPEEATEPEEPKKEEEKDPRDIALERKSTALSEERRKRKELEAKLKALEAKKAPKADDVDEEEEEVDAPAAPLDRESIIQEVENRRKQAEYQTNIDQEIFTIAKGAGKSKQWAQKVKETISSLPANIRSGHHATDVATAIRFMESASGSQAFSMPGAGSSVDLPFGPGSSTNELSPGAREFIKQEMRLDDKTVDTFLNTPMKRLENGNLSFKLIK